MSYRLPLAICSAAAVLAAAAPLAAAPTTSDATEASDGRSDFDWEFGTWETRVRLLRNPLSGEPPEWASYEGTSIVKPLMDGRANFVELSVSGSAGAIRGGSLRLFNPAAWQWSLNYASLGNGLLTAPVFGAFDASGRGVFVGQDQLGSRTILVRFIISRPSANEAHFVQSYSADGGKTWEDNWIATDTRR